MTKVNFTKRCLADALFSLLKEKRFTDISIQDIVDKAGFSRMAYYRNFKSIEEIIYYYIDEYVKSIYTRNSIINNAATLDEAISNFFAVIADERIKEISTILHNQYMLGLVVVILRERNKELGNPNKKYFDSFILGGLFETWINWVEGGFKETPEELISYLHQVLYQEFTKLKP